MTRRKYARKVVWWLQLGLPCGRPGLLSSSRAVPSERIPRIYAGHKSLPWSTASHERGEDIFLRMIETPLRNCLDSHPPITYSGG